MLPENLKISIANLWEEFGSTERIGLATAFNTTMTVIGLAAFWYFSGIIAYICLMWAIIHFGAMAQWVVNQ